MKRESILVLVLIGFLVAPAVMRAHEGHSHKVLGTVASVQASRVDVKSTDGKIVTITLDAKTAVTRGKAKMDATALKIGERVSIDYVQQKSVNIAKTVKLAEVPAPAPAKK